MKKTVRHLAVDILNQVGRSSGFAEDLLNLELERQTLSGTVNGRLLTHLVYGTLRMQGHLDWILARLYRGNYEKMEDSVKNILRTGLYQLRFSNRLPSFAVVDEAVKIAKSLAPATSGLINAVLRGYLRNADKILFPSPESHPAESIFTRHSHPRWLVELWLDAFGAQETETICQANNELPPLTLRVNTLKTDREALLEMLKNENFSCTPTQFSPDGITLHDPPHPVQKTTFFQQGLLRIQDEAAQLVSLLVCPKQNSLILDVCAGSGGKTTHLAALMKNEGRIVALDGDAGKIARLKKDAARMGISMIESGQANLLSPLPAKWIDKFDAVFVDAPCSGTGTLRRNPEIKWRLHSGDIEHFKNMQITILQNAAAAVKKEGRLVYCTCSVLPSENEYVIGKFLADFPQFRVERPTDEILQSLTSRRGYFQTFPHRHSLDGFFGAVLSRRI